LSPNRWRIRCSSPVKRPSSTAIKPRYTEPYTPASEPPERCFEASTFDAADDQAFDDQPLGERIHEHRRNGRNQGAGHHLAPVEDVLAEHLRGRLLLGPDDGRR